MYSSTSAAQCRFYGINYTYNYYVKFYNYYKTLDILFTNSIFYNCY